MSNLNLIFPSPILFVTEIDVLIQHLNYANHLGNDAFVSILQEARGRFLAENNMSELNVEHSMLLVVNLTIKYKAQVWYPDKLKIEVAADKPKSRAVDLYYRVYSSSSAKEVAIAKTGIMFYNTSSQKVIAVPLCFAQLIK